MAHELDFTTGQAAIAYAGETPWHKHGTPARKEWTLDDWISNARVGYEVVRVPALAHVGTIASKGAIDGVIPVEGAYFNIRSDTGAILGTQTHTDRRVEVQPREIMHFVYDTVAADDRFSMEVMGAIKKGAQIWATARYNGDLSVAGEKHNAFLLARTAFDGSLATHFYMTVVRAICANTLAAGWDKRAMVTLRHTTKFDPSVARKQLAAMAQSVDTFKSAGDALAQAEMAREDTAKLFKQLLDIPFDAKADDVSTRKMNQFRELSSCYSLSVAEGAPRDTGWAALQAVTRYVDHQRSSRNNEESGDDSRFVSAQFGSGAALKGKAMGLLMPLIRDRVPVLAS